jgi:hypothetical protein
MDSSGLPYPVLDDGCHVYWPHTCFSSAEEKNLAYFWRIRMKLIVVIDDEILPEGAEKLEDALAEFLGLRGLKGKIDDELTGNTTVFPIVPDWIPSKSDYRYCEDCKGFFDFWNTAKTRN